MPVFFSLKISSPRAVGARRRGASGMRAHHVRFSNSNFQCSSHLGAIGRPILQPSRKSSLQRGTGPISGRSDSGDYGSWTGYGRLASTELADASSEIDPSPTSNGIDRPASTDHVRSHGIAIRLNDIGWAELCTVQNVVDDVVNRRSPAKLENGDRDFTRRQRSRGLPRSRRPAGSCQAPAAANAG
jgi:hypothetical protein